MEHIYKVCFYGGLTCAVFLFILAIILFVKFNIPKVYGDLTGKTEKKIIKGMNANIRMTSMARKGEQDKYYRGAYEKIKARKAKINEFDSEEETSVLSEFSAEEETSVLSEFNAEEETSVLSEFNTEEETQLLLNETEETSVLTPDKEEETSILSNQEEETGILSNKEEETSVLSGKEEETSVLVAGEAVAARVYGFEDDIDAADPKELPKRINKLAGKTKVYFDVVVVHTSESLCHDNGRESVR